MACVLSFHVASPTAKASPRSSKIRAGLNSIRFSGNARIATRRFAVAKEIGSRFDVDQRARRLVGAAAL
jgi:hypothetical protein